MAKIKLEVIGKSQLKKLLDTTLQTVDNATKEIIRVNALDMQRISTQRAPQVYKYNHGGVQRVNGEIGQSIHAESVSEWEWMVSVNSVMGAYAEFGTGAYVEVPAGFEYVAWSYYKNGKGVMLPQPYFYPTWTEIQKQFVQDLENLLQQVAQKYG